MQGSGLDSTHLCFRGAKFALNLRQFEIHRVRPQRGPLDGSTSPTAWSRIVQRNAP